MILAIFKVFVSPLFEEILKYEFPKKFSAPIFDYYFRASDPVQHIRYFLDKMIDHSPNDAFTCLTFSSSMKGMASD